MLVNQNSLHRDYSDLKKIIQKKKKKDNSDLIVSAILSNAEDCGQLWKTEADRVQ